MSSNMDVSNLAIVNNKMMSVKRNQAEAAHSYMRRKKVIKMGKYKMRRKRMKIRRREARTNRRRTGVTDSGRRKQRWAG